VYFIVVYWNGNRQIHDFGLGWALFSELEKSDDLLGFSFWGHFVGSSKTDNLFSRHAFKAPQ
jgi:hypothetical protein